MKTVMGNQKRDTEELEMAGKVQILTFTILIEDHPCVIMLY